MPMPRSAPPKPSSLQDVNELIERARQLADRALDPATQTEDWETLSSELESLSVGLQSAQQAAIPSVRRSAAVVDDRPIVISKPADGPVSKPPVAPEPIDVVEAPVNDAPEPEQTTVPERSIAQATDRPSKKTGWRRTFIIVVLMLAVGFAAGYLWMIASVAIRAQRTAMSSG